MVLAAGFGWFDAVAWASGSTVAAVGVAALWPLFGLASWVEVAESDPERAGRVVRVGPGGALETLAEAAGRGGLPEWGELADEVWHRDPDGWLRAVFVVAAQGDAAAAAGLAEMVWPRGRAGLADALWPGGPGGLADEVLPWGLSVGVAS